MRRRECRDYLSVTGPDKVVRAVMFVPTWQVAGFIDGPEIASIR